MQLCYTDSMTVMLEIPEDILASARMSPEDALLELALALYASRRLSIGKARELVGMSLWQFRQIAAARGHDLRSRCVPTLLNSRASARTDRAIVSRKMRVLRSRKRPA